MTRPGNPPTNSGISGLLPPEEPAQRPPRPDNVWYKLLWLPIMAALALGIGLYATGAPLSRSIGVALVIGVVVWLVVKSLTLPPPAWPQPPDDFVEWGRARRLWEVTGLEAALERPEYMSRRILVQLAEIAEQVLHRRNLTLGHPRAGELLSPRGIELLTDPEAKAPSKNELRTLIDTIMVLATDGGDGSRPLPVAPALVPASSRPRRLPVGRKVSRGPAASASSSGPAPNLAANNTSATGGTATDSAASSVADSSTGRGTR